jgi:methyl-accepting chemotaxis protein
VTQNGMLEKNEFEANRFAAKVMLLTIIFVAVIYILDVVGIFIAPVDVMTIAMGAGAVLLAIPALLIFVLKKQGPWVKYVVTISAVLMVSIVITFLSWHTVLMYIYPVAIASLYFSRRLSWFTVILTLVATAVAQVLSLYANSIMDRNLPALYENIVYGVVPRALQFMVISLIFIMLSKRTRAMLQNVMGAEEQADMLKRMMDVTTKTKEVSGVLAESVQHLSIITENTTKANEQISGNTQRIAAGSEDTLRYMDQASDTVIGISTSINLIAEESKRISELSQQVRALTVESGKVIENAVNEMNVISEATQASKSIVGRLEERSVEISRIIDVISGISEQTNMLALNAAIESARAGEQGRGFAVVAGQIRILAEQSQQAANDIALLIEEVMVDTKKAVDAMDNSSALVGSGLELIQNAGSSFEKVSASGSEMHKKISEVSSATQDVAENSKKIVEIVEGIKTISEQTLSELQEIAAAVEEQMASMQQVSSSVLSIEGMSNELVKI